MQYTKEQVNDILRTLEECAEEYSHMDWVFDADSGTICCADTERGYAYDITERAGTYSDMEVHITYAGVSEWSFYHNLTGLVDLLDNGY